MVVKLTAPITGLVLKALEILQVRTEPLNSGCPTTCAVL